MTPKALSRDTANKNQCIYTVETGKHEWYTLHSTGNKGIWYDFCPSCHYVDVYGAIKKAGLWKLLKVLLTKENK